MHVHHRPEAWDTRHDPEHLTPVTLFESEMRSVRRGVCLALFGFAEARDEFDAAIRCFLHKSTAVALDFAAQPGAV